MALNRESRRRLQRQGEIGADGAPAPPTRRQPRASRQQSPAEERATPRQFVREVRGELRKVAWPTRPETLHYSLVVLVTLIVMGTLIFVVDLLFGWAVGLLYEVS